MKLQKVGLTKQEEKLAKTKAPNIFLFGA